MQTGTKISVLGHTALISWALVGGWFNAEPLPVPTQDVSLISIEEFARLSQDRAAPEVSELAEAPALPEAAQAAPDIPDRPDPAPVPEPEPNPVAEPLPEEALEPLAEEVVPEFTPIAPIAPDLPDLVTDLPQTVEPETAQAIDRVAPEPIASPEPDVRIDDVTREEVAPDEGAEADQPAQEATAEEAASDRLVTEAEADNAEPTAPRSAPRPQRRPSRPVAEPEPERVAQPEPSPTLEPVDPFQDAIGDALAEAQASGEVEAPEVSGPPMTEGERDVLRLSVSKCWNVGSLSSDALRTTVVVGMSLSQAGVPDQSSIRMLSSGGGSAAAAQQAYRAARRAIIRCGAKGFDLPADKYAQWRDIEMTFNPERMRIK